MVNVGRHADEIETESQNPDRTRWIAVADNSVFASYCENAFHFFPRRLPVQCSLAGFAEEEER